MFMKAYILLCIMLIITSFADTSKQKTCEERLDALIKQVDSYEPTGVDLDYYKFALGLFCKQNNNDPVKAFEAIKKYVTKK